MKLPEQQKVYRTRAGAPDGALHDVISQKNLKMSSVKGTKGTVIAFLCNHCPFVSHIIHQVAFLGMSYAKQGVNFLAISPSDALQFPKDSPDHMRAFAQEYKLSFPYFYDESQSLSKLFGVTCTPDFYVLDSDWRIFYHGQFDESRPGNTIPVTGDNLTRAIDCLINGEDYLVKPTPSVGCLVRWK